MMELVDINRPYFRETDSELLFEYISMYETVNFIEDAKNHQDFYENYYKKINVKTSELKHKLDHLDKTVYRLKKIKKEFYINFLNYREFRIYNFLYEKYKDIYDTYEQLVSGNLGNIMRIYFELKSKLSHATSNREYIHFDISFFEQNISEILKFYNNSEIKHMICYENVLSYYENTITSQNQVFDIINQYSLDEIVDECKQLYNAAFIYLPYSLCDVYFSLYVNKLHNSSVSNTFDMLFKEIGYISSKDDDINIMKLLVMRNLSEKCLLIEKFVDYPMFYSIDIDKLKANKVYSTFPREITDVPLSELFQRLKTLHGTSDLLVGLIFLADIVEMINILVLFENTINNLLIELFGTDYDKIDLLSAYRFFYELLFIETQKIINNISDIIRVIYFVQKYSDFIAIKLYCLNINFEDF